MRKKRFIATAGFLMTLVLLFSTVGASAAVYVQDGKYKYQLFTDNTVALAGYISDTVDDVTVPRYYDQSTVVSVTDYGLADNQSIRSIDFMTAPELSKIGKYAFYKCTSLETLLVPNSIQKVEISAFRECTGLEKVEFYGNDNSVPIEAFYGCSALKDVRLSARIKSIQSCAFAGCTSLEYLELTDSIVYIASNAFTDDDNLTLGVWYDSYAYNYVVENQLQYVLLDGVKLGDTDGDGYVNINDVTAIQRHLAELEHLEGIYLHAADANQDGTVDIADATIIQMYLAEYDMEYPIGEVMTQ